MFVCCRSVLTVGKMDGLQGTKSGGRGSFLGLNQVLNVEVMTSVVQESLLPVVLWSEQSLMEANACNKDPLQEIDLLIRSIYDPITSRLLDLCPNNSLFSSGIASVFHRCFSALDQFHELLGNCVTTHFESSPGSFDESGKLLGKFTRSRFHSHPSVLSFQGKWNTKLYYQVIFDIYILLFFC